MKKILKFGLLIIIIIFITIPALDVFALDESMTFKEIENVLVQYFKENNKKMELGTCEIAEYFKNQLMYDADEELANHENYEEILAYAAEYLNEFTKNNNNKEVCMDQYADKTIKDVKREISLEESKIDCYNGERFKNIYNIGEAVKYAHKYALEYNPKYTKYDGHDCTNFISQVICAGGMNPTSPNITKYSSSLSTDENYWYSIYIKDGSDEFIKDSITWVNVPLFNKYWRKRVKCESYKTREEIQKYANIGDVMQYKYPTTGRLYHSTFVSNKIDGYVYVTQHSDDRKEIRWMDYDINNSEYELLKFS